MKALVTAAVALGLLAATGPALAQSATPSPRGYVGYKGEWHNPDGTIQMRARTYAPALRRFLTADPSSGDPIPNTNGYSYVAGNPATWSDPSGLRTGGKGQRPQDACTHPPQVCRFIAERNGSAPEDPIGNFVIDSLAGGLAGPLRRALAGGAGAAERFVRNLVSPKLPRWTGPQGIIYVTGSPTSATIGEIGRALQSNGAGTRARAALVHDAIEHGGGRVNTSLPGEYLANRFGREIDNVANTGLVPDDYVGRFIERAAAYNGMAPQDFASTVRPYTSIEQGLRPYRNPPKRITDLVVPLPAPYGP